MYGFVKAIMGAARLILTRSTAASAARLAVVWSAVTVTEPFSLLVTTSKVMARKVMMARRIRVMTRAMPDEGDVFRVPCSVFRGRRGETPSPKSQIPKKSQTPNLKTGRGWLVWDLGFGIFLGFGIWDLGFIATHSWAAAPGRQDVRLPKEILL